MMVPAENGGIRQQQKNLELKICSTQALIERATVPDVLPRRAIVAMVVSIRRD
jgi:hypothetical protein